MSSRADRAIATRPGYWFATVTTTATTVATTLTPVRSVMTFVRCWIDSVIRSIRSIRSDDSTSDLRWSSRR